MRKISASEISTFLYCERAWWYQHQGIESSNIQELGSGNELHQRHSRTVATSGLMKLAAYGMILAAMIMLSIYLVLQIL